MSEKPTLLSIRDLSVEFETPSGTFSAIRNLSFDLAEGETLAIVGESGSGKSTLASAINGLLAANGRIASGSILFGDTDIAQADEKTLRTIRGAGIGLVPQDPMSNLNPLHRVGTQIREALEVHGRSSGKEADAQAIDLLRMVGIPEPERRASQFPHELSGGMRQRVLIAIGLACRPRLLIADEPTSALDVTISRVILDELQSLTRKLGTAVILITHDLALAAERADKVLVLFRGDVVENGPAQAVLSKPSHDYTRQLLAAAPNLNSRRLVPARDVITLLDRKPMTRTERYLVELANVRKEYPLRRTLFGKPESFVAVEGSTLDIPRRQTVAIVGESGSGKSTTAKLLLKIEDVTSGNIAFDGQEITHLNSRELMEFRRRVQPVFQNPYASLDGRYTIAQSIREPLLLHRIGDAKSQRKRVLDVLDQVALPAAMAERLPHELSGGQRQRVAIARALVLEPELVVLDEAVSALDVVVQAQILQLLVELQNTLGLSYLFISHDLAVVRMIAHQVHVMHKGRIVESGTPERIFDAPQAEYTCQLLSAIPGSGLRQKAAERYCQTV